MNVALRTSLRGVGDAGEDFWDSFFVDESPAPAAPSPGDVTTLNIGGGYVGAPETGTTPGYAGVTPIPGSTGIDAAALLKAVSAGTLVLSRINAGTGRPACPSGYQYPNGSCLPVAPAAGGSQAVISGVPNSVLLLGIGVLALLAVGGKK